MAKLIVKKNGKKDHLNAEDCIKINNRRSGDKSTSRSPQKEKRWVYIYQWFCVSLHKYQLKTDSFKLMLKKRDSLFQWYNYIAANCFPKIEKGRESL